MLLSPGDGFDDGVLVGEVVVDVPGAHAGFAADPRNAGAMKAMPTKADGGGIKHLLATHLSLLSIQGSETTDIIEGDSQSLARLCR